MGFAIVKIIGILFIVWILYLTYSVIRRKLKCPEKTVKNCVINELLTPVRMMKLGPYKNGDRQMYDIQLNINYAVKKVKLSDLGDTEFLDQFKMIMNSSVQRQQVYTNLGYISAKIELSMNFVRRVSLINYFHEVPSVLTIPIRAPVFVMGLPRTGTTFLHRLLSLDPAVRAPLLWELVNPVPTVKEYNYENMAKDRTKRAKFIKGIISTRKNMGDHALDHIHEIEYDLPEECLMGLSDSLPLMLQYLYSNYMNLHEYLKLDSTKAYDGYKNLLRLLSYQIGEAENPRKWMLKCPIHLFYIKEIAKVFPDAQLIWTHRHPISAVPSLCSLVKSFHSCYYEPEQCDVHTLGRTIYEHTGNILNHATTMLEETKTQCSHVIYNELIKNPVETVRNIYKQMGWPFTDEYQRIMQEYLDDNAKKRLEMSKKNAQDGAVLHHYTPETYAMTETELCTGAYAEYIQKYNVPMSKN